MRIPHRAAALLLLALPALAADSIYGVWQMRKNEKNGGMKSQVLKVEPSGGATKFSYDIERSGGKIAYYFVTKLDGAEVPAISNGTEIMKIRVKRIGPNEFDSSSSVQGTETRFKTIVSKDGNVMTTDGTIATQGKSIPSHVVFDRVK